MQKDTQLSGLCDFLLASSDFDFQLFFDNHNIAVKSSFDGLHLSTALQVLCMQPLSLLSRLACWNPFSMGHAH